MEPRHRDALDEATGTGERWSSLHGCLVDHADGRYAGCPDQISQEVVRRYVITSLGRLFRLIWPADPNNLQGDVLEMSPIVRSKGVVRHQMEVDGVKWEPRASTLVNRAFVPLDARSPSTTTQRRGGLDMVSLEETIERTQSSGRDH